MTSTPDAVDAARHARSPAPRELIVSDPLRITCRGTPEAERLAEALLLVGSELHQRPCRAGTNWYFGVYFSVSLRLGVRLLEPVSARGNRTTSSTRLPALHPVSGYPAGPPVCFVYMLILSSRRVSLLAMSCSEYIPHPRELRRSMMIRVSCGAGRHRAGGGGRDTPRGCSCC